ncbi:MAG: hypothetical protein RQ899_12290 [Pseudomonadales bacterium]|nr:hypothetical protein [Pseudomonadales bacterium]
MSRSIVLSLVSVGLFVWSVPGMAEVEERSAGHVPERSEYGPHHVSIFAGATDLRRKAEPMAGEGVGEGMEEDRRDDTAATFALDYEYRVTSRVGLGVVVEQTAGAFNATTVLDVADIHLFHGLVMQVGPGLEFIEHQTNVVGRIGGLYEFEFDHFTLSPQIHYDVTDKEDSLVFGLALGVNF